MARPFVCQFICAGLFGLLAVGVLGCGPAPDSGEAIRAPSFALRSLQGEEVTLESLKGQVVILDFWATWCAPCVKQIPILNHFYEVNRRDGVAVYGISVDVDGAAAVGPFAEKHEFRYPVLIGSVSLADSYGVTGFPATVVIDADGNVRGRHAGVAGERALDKMVAAARVRIASKDQR